MNVPAPPVPGLRREMSGLGGLLVTLAIVGMRVGVHRLVVRGNPAWAHRD